MPNTLDDVAGELYSLRPDQFTAARKQRIADARGSGDRQLAADIGKLRRPTASAALVNLLTRSRPDLIDGLLGVAQEMRHAQSALAGEDLLRLSTRRAEVIAALVGEGRRLAREREFAFTAQVESEITATYHAALADPEAAAAVRSARLTTSLHYSGFGRSVDLSTAQPAPSEQREQSQQGEQREERQQRGPRGTLRRGSPAPTCSAATVRLRKVEAAQQALAAAETRLEALAEVAGQAEQEVQAAVAQRQQAAESIAELEERLSRAREQERQAIRDLRAREKARDRAQRAALAARRRADETRKSAGE
ncbi:MAG: hypothetical protein WCB04_13760 [Mycobacteriales bacterium]